MPIKKEVIIGNCRLLLGKVDAVVTDPPFEFEACGGGIGKQRKYLSDIEGKKLNKGVDYSFLDNHKRWAVFANKKQLLPLIQKAAVLDLNWSLISWIKPNPTPLINNNYLPDTEYIIHAGQVFGGYSDKSKYIIHNSGKSEFNHPTVKPLAVMIKIVKNASNNDESILDPFMGSGTTGVACVKMGRSFIGIEQDPNYFEIACKRITEAYKQPDMFIAPPEPKMIQEAML